MPTRCRFAAGFVAGLIAVVVLSDSLLTSGSGRIVGRAEAASLFGAGGDDETTPPPTCPSDADTTSGGCCGLDSTTIIVAGSSGKSSGNDYACMSQCTDRQPNLGGCD